MFLKLTGVVSVVIPVWYWAGFRVSQLLSILSLGYSAGADSRNMAVMNVSERCLTSFYSSHGQVLDMEMSLTNQTEEHNNIISMIYGQFPSLRFTCRKEGLKGLKALKKMQGFDTSINLNCGL